MSFFISTCFKMTSIQNVSSCPAYINAFIESNKEQLSTIYEAGYAANENEGCLGMYCNEETNKMDVMFLNRMAMCKFLTVESWEQLKQSIPQDKKLFFVKDEGLNSIFLLFI